MGKLLQNCPFISTHCYFKGPKRSTICTAFINFSAILWVHLHLHVDTGKNAKIRPDDLALFVILASSLNLTPETLQILEGLPSADRVLDRIGEQLSRPELVSRVNQLLRQIALSVDFPPRAKVIVAVDLTGDPFYGAKNTPWIVGTKPQQGTSYEVRFMTLSRLIKGHRFPLALYPITQLDMPRLGEYLLETLNWYAQHVQIDLILMDRGFNDSELFEALDQAGYQFIVPLIENDKLREVIEAAVHGRAPQVRARGYIVKDYPYGARGARYRLAIRRRRKLKKKKSKWISFLTNTQLAPKTIDHLYSRRWGIETSYNQIHQVTAETKSPRYPVRVALMATGTVLFALWVRLNWTLCVIQRERRHKRAGKRRCTALARFKIQITLPGLKLRLILGLLAQLSEQR